MEPKPTISNATSNATSSSTLIASTSTKDVNPALESLFASKQGNPGENAMHGTATVKIVQGTKIHQVRAVVDNGSQSNYITEKVANKLNLKRKGAPTFINGIGNYKSIFSHGFVTVQIQSNVDDTWNSFIDCYVLREITGDKPSKYYDNSD